MTQKELFDLLHGVLLKYTFVVHHDHVTFEKLCFYLQFMYTIFINDRACKKNIMLHFSNKK